MPIKVRNVGQIVGSKIIVVDRWGGDLAAILTNLGPSEEGDGPSWELPLTIGEGPSKRNVLVTLAVFLSHQQYEKSNTEPLKFTTGDEVHFILFRDRFFMADRKSLSESERDEATLRVKRAVYRDEEELKSLRSYVANVESALESRKSGPQRTAISDDVKMAVWSRDGGACTRCNSKEKLHFDHIIPVAKGGGNSVENIQLLCEPCNLRKSDKIGF